MENTPSTSNVASSNNPHQRLNDAAPSPSRSSSSIKIEQLDHIVAAAYQVQRATIEGKSSKLADKRQQYDSARRCSRIEN